jgi:hypothetical protein
MTASAYGNTPANYFGFPNGLVPYIPAFLGAEVLCQTIWNDTVSGAVKLSAASSAKVPELGIESNDAARRKCVYTYNKTLTTG